MKKLLSMLGAMTLIGTTSSSVIACGGENPTPPTPDTRTDLKDLPKTTNVTIRSDSSDKISDFKKLLITELKKQLGFDKLTQEDVDISKADGNTLTDNDIIQSTLNTKIKVKTTSKNFTGEKTISVTINISLNIEVEKQLKLTTVKGEGVQTASLDLTIKDNVTWTVEALKTPINASELLKAEDKAANEACFDFITNSLKLKPKQGTTFEDGVFDKATLEQIIGIVTDIKPDLVKTDDSKDYAVTGGNFSFQFKKGEEKIGDAYNIKLKADKTKGVIAADLTKIVDKIAIADTDVVTNPNILFVKSEKIPKSAQKGVTIGIVDITDNGKQFLALNKITGLNIIAQFDSRSSGTHWDRGDWLKINYKNTGVNFDPNKTFTEFTMV